MEGTLAGLQTWNGPAPPSASPLSPPSSPGPEIQVWVAVKQQGLTSELRAGDPHGQFLEHEQVHPSPELLPAPTSTLPHSTAVPFLPRLTTMLIGGSNATGTYRAQTEHRPTTDLVNKWSQIITRFEQLQVQPDRWEGPQPEVMLLNKHQQSRAPSPTTGTCMLLSLVLS